MADKCLNNSRSPGTDGIPTELYKHKLLQYIHSIVTDAWERESLPAEIEAILGWYRTGFREGKSTVNKTHTSYGKCWKER